MPVKIGVLGAGHLGKIHLQCLQKVSRCEIAGFYDVNPETSEKVAQETGLSAFQSYDDLLASVDAIDIVTPTSTHFQLAKKALLAGKHIFVEKPVTSLVSEAEELEVLERDSGLVVQVGHVERFNPAMLAIKGLRLDPKFIEVHRLAHFNPRGTDVSVVLDLMIHDLDIVLQLVPSPVKRVLANGVNLVSRTPDIGNARIEWENGCVANVTASRMSFKQMRKMRIFQPDRYIGLDFLERSAQIIHLEDGDAGTEATNTTFILETSTGHKTVKIDTPKVEEVNAIEMELSCFVDSILEGKKPEVGIREALKALRLAFQISDVIDHNLNQFLEDK